MIQMQGFGRKYIKAFLKGFFVAVPVTVTFLDRVACIARVEGTSMQPSLNPVEQQVSDIVLLNHWSIQNYEVQRGDIVSLVNFALCHHILSLLLDLLLPQPTCHRKASTTPCNASIMPLCLQNCHKDIAKVSQKHCKGPTALSAGSTL